MENIQDNISGDVEAINRIPIISSLLEVVCTTTGMGFAAVARVTEQKWVACCVLDKINFGLKPGGELQLDTTICNEIRQSHEAVVIDDVPNDSNFKHHKTPILYGFRSYISFPIFKKDGSFFGTLCAIDPTPAKVNSPAIIGMFKMFAELISFHLNALEEITISENKIAENFKTEELREQFIAILGHDLRNPVSAIANSAELLTMTPHEKDILRIAHIIKNSTSRMSALINNMLDFASGRMGGGIPLSKENNIPVEKIITNVITEVSAIWANQKIYTNFNLAKPVKADGNRIAQLFLNLLRNAITYGKADAAVIVNASSVGENFILSIFNEGDPIPAEAMEHLFKPFSRGVVNKGLQGLGLGLYIAAEIAKAHDGKLEVLSDNEGTKFTLTIPLN